MNAAGVPRIERRCRLVQEQNLRPVKQGPCQRDALLYSFGQIFDGGLPIVGQNDLLQRFRRSAGRHLVQLAEPFQIVLHRQPVVQSDAVGQDADAGQMPVSLGFRHTGDILPEYARRPGCRRQLGGQYFNRGHLVAVILPEPLGPRKPNVSPL